MPDLQFLADSIAARNGPAHVDGLFSLTATSDRVAIGDVDPVEPSFRPLQRSLVSSSLRKTGAKPHGRGPAHSRS